MLKQYCAIFLGLLIIFTGCADTKLLSPQDIENSLQKMETIQIMETPYEDHLIYINDDFLTMLNIDDWIASEPKISQTNISSMLYFDISSTQNYSEYSRVAIFSNSYAMIQLFRNGEFGERRFYACSDCDNYYTNLFEYVIKNAQSD